MDIDDMIRSLCQDGSEPAHVGELSSEELAEHEILLQHQAWLNDANAKFGDQWAHFITGLRIKHNVHGKAIEIRDGKVYVA